MSVLVAVDVVPCPGVGSPIPAAAAPAGVQPLQQRPPANAQLQFLNNWKASIAPKLHQLLAVLAGKDVAQSMAIAQIWTYLPVLTEGRQILKAEQLCLLGDAELQQFHAGCTAEGVTVSQLGPMGKVWESGAVQVVQYAESLSEDTHPRNRLPGELSLCIGECIYVPVYDSTGQVSQGVLAVVELLIRSHACDYMVVANAISCLAHVMEALQLSISNPHSHQTPMPAKGGTAGGRLGAKGSGSTAASGPAQLPHSSSNKSASGSAASSGGSLSFGRTASMRTFN